MDAPLDRGLSRTDRVVDVTNEMRIAQEEIVGPVLSVIAYHDDADAVRIANDSILRIGPTNRNHLS